MSKALSELIERYFRLPSGKSYSFHDPGTPPIPSDVASAIGLLPERQRQVIDEAAMEELRDGLNHAFETVDRFGRPAVKGDKSALVKAVMQRDPLSRGVTLTNWAIFIGLSQRKDTPFTYNDLKSACDWWVREAFKHVSGRKYALTREQALAIIDADRTHDSRGYGDFSYKVVDVALDAIAQNRDGWTFGNDDRVTFIQVAEALSKYPNAGKTRTRIAMLRELVSAVPTVPLWDKEAWAKAILDSLAGMNAGARVDWSRLLTFGGTCSMSKPSRDWLAEAAKLSKGVNDFEANMTAWLRAVIAAPRLAEPPGGNVRFRDNAWYDARASHLANTTNAVGLVWLAAANWSPAFAPLLADVAESVAKWPQDVRGPSANIGAAAVKALGSREDDESLAQLSKLEMRIRWPKLKSVVKKQLADTIARRGLDRTDVEESMVPDFGLHDGVAVLPFTGVSAEIALGRSDKPTLSWKREGDSKPSRTFSAALKAENPDATERARHVVSDIEKMRAAQRTRLDLLMRRDRSWRYAEWRLRYLDHGLVSSLARRLIWIVDGTPVVWHDGALVSVEGKQRNFREQAEVRMWHPATQPVAEVVAWREALEAREIAQPFKQAHREIYLLTDAERQTRTYSNRFAAHIVRSMTLLSISQIRQWKTGLFGGQSSPSFELVDHGLRAEWWLEPAGEEHTPFGAPLYMASDQVRFLCTSDAALKRYEHSTTADPLPLEKVPPLALSEAMRDVDLFVALASVGNDPEWQDGGPGGRHRDYWRQYSFGELTEYAKTRKAALERLTPRLAIRDRCSVNGNFLSVRGNIRTYKIHLGSGNILMEPNDQYLCIVPARGQAAASSDGAGGGLFLPFEGDQTLSVILSKAFMLAADDKITDPSITRQLAMR